MTLPYESLLGVSFGLMLGFAAALVVFFLVFLLRATTDRQVPRVGGVVLTLGLAAVIGSTLGVVDPTAIQSQAPRVAAATALVTLVGLGATSQADRIAATLPHNTPFPLVRGRPLAPDAVNAVDAVGHVTVRAAGDIREFDGHPPLSPALRQALEAGAWRLPADLPLSELEVRLETRLRWRYDLAAVSVSIDGRGRATIAVAPSQAGAGSRVPTDHRAVSVTALLPTGLAPGDCVDIAVDSGSDADADTDSVAGTVLAVGSATGAVHPASDETLTGRVETASATHLEQTVTDAFVPSRTAAASGGQNRVTLAVPTGDATRLLHASHARLTVRPSGTRHDFEACSLLAAAGCAIRAITVDIEALEALAAADTVAILASRRQCRGSERAQWEFEPDLTTIDEPAALFVVTDGPTAVIDTSSERGTVEGTP